MERILSNGLHEYLDSLQEKMNKVDSCILERFCNTAARRARRPAPMRTDSGMPIRVALHHKTTYSYDRLVQLSPQVIRLRPAPHCRTPVTAYSLKIEPNRHF